MNRRLLWRYLNAPTQNVHVFIIEDNGGIGKTALFRGIGRALKPFMVFISVDDITGSPFDRGVEFAKTEKAGKSSCRMSPMKSANDQPVNCAN